jgi:hypothetical protein
MILLIFVKKFQIFYTKKMKKELTPFQYIHFKGMFNVTKMAIVNTKM